jgi:hypothetical protein
MTPRTRSWWLLVVSAFATVTIAGMAQRAEQAAAVPIGPEKQLVLDYLSQPRVVEEFGRISDAIWSYAELGLHESRSSRLLADTLERAGFTV